MTESAGGDVEWPVFVAEFTINHMGNLNALLRMVDKAAEVGCDFIKMQKKDVESFYARDKVDAPYESPYGKTYRDYRTIFEFDEEDYVRFDQRCQAQGIPWFSTIQDISSLYFMLRFNSPLYKVASSNARNKPLLQEMAQLVPNSAGIVLSVAGSTLAEIEQALNIFDGRRIYLLHCVAEYPCPPSSLRLGNIAVLRQQFASERITVGYSGHEVGTAPTLAAVDLGAKLVERHFCLSRHSFVHHIECSLEPREYRELIDIVRSGVPLREYYSNLPDDAFNSYFGMSVVERRFLVEQKYGRYYLGEGSAFET
jgi:N-acetylneuraminate synthase